MCARESCPPTCHVGRATINSTDRDGSRGAGCSPRSPRSTPAVRASCPSSPATQHSRLSRSPWSRSACAMQWSIESTDGGCLLGVEVVKPTAKRNHTIYSTHMRGTARRDFLALDEAVLHVFKHKREGARPPHGGATKQARIRIRGVRGEPSSAMPAAALGAPAAPAAQRDAAAAALCSMPLALGAADVKDIIDVVCRNMTAVAEGGRRLFNLEVERVAGRVALRSFQVLT